MSAAKHFESSSRTVTYAFGVMPPSNLRRLLVGLTRLSQGDPSYAPADSQYSHPSTTHHPQGKATVAKCFGNWGCR